MIDDARRRRLDEICDGALARSGSDREAFVATACADDAALRNEVDALLAHSEAAETFLSPPLGAIAADVLGDGDDTSLVGRQFSSYTIGEALGAGGMGQVYRARDAKLGRDVAFKTLRSSFARDPEWRARLAREARILASLNHPHIATIHGLEDADGVPALVMELVDGPTLADKLLGKRTPRGLPFAEALGIALQLADALEAAHDRGIVHRDLKPANIKVDRNGFVKVLDFGLAKAVSDNAAIGEIGATSWPAGTHAGVIIGTPAYMSPEQARAEAVDKRGDVWALGCILYEMLTGRAAFRRSTVSDTIAAIVDGQPDWTLLPTETPSAIQRLLRRCLMKDRRHRLRDIGDARMDIEEALAASAHPGSDIQVSERAHRKRNAALWLLAGGAAVAAITATRVLLVRPVDAGTEVRTEIVTPPTDAPLSFALSPDGEQVVFSSLGDDGHSHLWVRSMSTTTARLLPGTDAASNPFWAPDGKAIGFFTGNALKRLDLSGGTAQVLAPAIGGNAGTWSREGVSLFRPGGGQPGSASLMQMPASGGAPSPVPIAGPNAAAPQFLPDGRRFLFFARGRAAGDKAAGIYIGSLLGGAPTRITAAEGVGAFWPGGWLLWVRPGTQTLVAQRFDPMKALLSGDQITVADGVATDVDSVGRAAVSVSTSGLIAYRSSVGTRRQLTWFDRSGNVLGTIGDADADNLLLPRVSPDGRRVVVVRTVQGNQDLWLLDGVHTTRFTFDPARDTRPLWSPDGSQIAFASARSSAGQDIYIKPTAGTTGERLIVASSQTKGPTSWSRDGRFLMYFSTVGPPNTDIWAVPMTGDRAGAPWKYLDTPFHAAWGAISPDGRWVAYEGNESGRDEIYIRPFVTSDATTTPQWQVSKEGGIYPLWSLDGKEVYYLDTTGGMMAAQISVDGSGVVPGPPVMLFPTRITAGGVDRGAGRQYDLAPDGRFLIDAELNDSSPITLLQHWDPSRTK